MSSRFRYLMKNVGILTISNFTSKILVFLLVPIYTSVLSTSEYGIYDVVVSTIQLVVPMLSLNIAEAVMRFLMEKTYNHRDVIKIGLKYTSACYLLIVLAFLFIKVTPITTPIDSYLTLILIYSLSYIANQFLIQVAKGQERVLDLGIAGIVGTVILLSGNILLLLVFNCGLRGFFLANILCQMVPAFYLAFKVKISNSISFGACNRELQSEMLMYCLPLIFTTLGWWVNHSSDKYVVSIILGVASNGLLSVAYKIPSILNALQGIFVQAWQISAIKEFESQNDDAFYGIIFEIVNFFVCIACSLLIIFTKPLGSILYAKDFFAAWKFVPFLLVSSVINSASGLLGPILSAAKDSRNMAKSAIYGAVTNTVLNVIFVFRIGVQGATIATVIASYVIYFIRKKAVKGRVKVDNIHLIYLCWILLIVQSAFEVYSEVMVWQICIVLLLIILNSTTIKKIVLFLKQKLRSKK